MQAIYMCSHMSEGVSVYVCHSSGHVLLVFETVFLSGWDHHFFFKQGYLVRGPQGSSCLHLSNVGTTSDCHQRWLFMWMLDITLYVLMLSWKHFVEVSLYPLDFSIECICFPNR